jgi:tricorn protease-like protein
VSSDLIAFEYAGDLWVVPRGGGQARRLTSTPGVEIDPYFSPDGTQIAFTATVAGNTDVYVVPTAGGDPKRLTYHPGLDRARGWTPDGRRVIFSSNYPDIRSRDFNLFVVNTDGTGLEQVTFNPSFDGFPMFSPDGRKLVFASNRNARVRGDTNVFIADWVEIPTGDLRVTVYDPLRAVVLKAKVTIEGQAFKSGFETDENGGLAVRLPAGVYQVSVEMTGFRTFTRKDVRIGRGSAETLDAVLELRPPQTLTPARAAAQR